MRFLSLFSGIEAASVAWLPLGWECVAVAEIEPFPCSVLAHHYPETPNLGDVSKITDEQIAAIGPIDVVIGGSPCQDLSVAGKRAGLGGARSGLFFEQLRIFHAARHFCGARFLLWENVPGAFSSNKGGDFAAVVGALAGCKLPAPADGWGCEGVAVGDDGMVEWAVLDAQWFGVAQRRRRVFALLDTGDWASRPPILLEPESLRGDSAPSREAREDVTGSTGDGARVGCAPVAATLNAHYGDKQGLENQHVNQGCPLFVTHTLRGEGFDASEDGTGRGTPLVAVAFAPQAGGKQTTLGYDPDSSTSPTPMVRQTVAVAFGIGEQPEVGHCLRAGASKADKHESTTYVAQTVAFAQNTLDEVREMPYVGAQAAQPIGIFQDSEFGVAQYDSAGTLRAGRIPAHQMAIQPPTMQVRRLTPVECEFLQGFPRGYTNIPWRNKPGAPDGPRYKSLGNSMATPVIAWIGRQIEAAVTIDRLYGG